MTFIFESQLNKFVNVQEHNTKNYKKIKIIKCE